MEWLPDDMSDPSAEWWQDTIANHTEALRQKVQSYLSQAKATATGCLELGTEQCPARVQWRGQRMRVYQLVAWADLGKAPSPKTVIRHLCNHRACINPQYLAVGTQAQNLFDQRQKLAQDIAQDWSHQ